MALVLDFLVPEQDLDEPAQQAHPQMADADLTALAASLLEQPHPELLRAPPEEVKPKIADDLWTDFFAVL